MHFPHQVASPRLVTIRCRLFARYAEVAGTSEVSVELPDGSTIADAVACLRERLPRETLPDKPFTALNAMHALPQEKLHDGDELSFLPPIAGGEPEDFLTRESVNIESLIESVSRPDLGGTAVFLGSVRQGRDDGPVVSIEYTAYEEMANAEIDRILGEAANRWPAIRIGLRHRLGVILTGETSIGVAVAAPHRAEAFEACRWVVEQFKQRVPIWKKEFYQDGSAAWRANDGTRAPSALS